MSNEPSPTPSPTPAPIDENKRTRRNSARVSYVTDADEGDNPNLVDRHQLVVMMHTHLKHHSEKSGKDKDDILQELIEDARLLDLSARSTKSVSTDRRNSMVRSKSFTGKQFQKRKRNIRRRKLKKKILPYLWKLMIALIITIYYIVGHFFCKYARGLHTRMNFFYFHLSQTIHHASQSI
jgi:hypothetical protein